MKHKVKYKPVTIKATSRQKQLLYCYCEDRLASAIKSSNYGVITLPDQLEVDDLYLVLCASKFRDKWCVIAGDLFEKIKPYASKCLRILYPDLWIEVEYGNNE